MKRKFTFYLLALIVLSCTTIALIVGGYSLFIMKGILDAQKQDVVQQVHSKARVFDQVLSNIEQELNANAEKALLGIEKAVMVEGKVRPDVSQEDLHQLAQTYNVTEIYLIDANGVVFNTTFNPDMGLDLFSLDENFAAFLKSLYGANRFKHQRIALSLNNGIVNKYSYYSPANTEVILETSSNIQEIIYQKYSEQFHHFLFSELFESLIDQNQYLQSIDIHHVQSKWSFLNPGQKLEKPNDFFEQLKKEKEIIHQEDGVVTIYKLMDLDDTRFDFSEAMMMSLRYDFTFLYQFTINTSWFTGLSTMVIILFAFGVSSRFFNSYFIERVIHINEGLSHIEHGNYTSPLKIEGQDELAEIAANINKMQGEINRRETDLKQLNQAFDKFVPHAFIQHLNKDQVVDLKLGDNVEANMTVLFMDIRSFTQLSENMTPKDNFQFINAYLKRMGPVIREHGGFIDKYIGDAIMALFENAEQAVRAAVAMQRQLNQYNVERQRAGYRPICVGIGINTGRLRLGTIGEDHRMQTTVISDVVNVASRLESMTKTYQVNILVSDETFCHLAKRLDYEIRIIDRVKAKGKSQSTTIFEIYADYDAHTECKQRIQTIFEQGFSLYALSKFEEALYHFHEALKICPDDRASQIYASRCKAELD